MASTVAAKGQPPRPADLSGRCGPRCGHHAAAAASAEAQGRSGKARSQAYREKVHVVLRRTVMALAADSETLEGKYIPSGLTIWK